MIDNWLFKIKDLNEKNIFFVLIRILLIFKSLDLDQAADIVRQRAKVDVNYFPARIWEVAIWLKFECRNLLSICDAKDPDHLVIEAGGSQKITI